MSRADLGQAPAAGLRAGTAWCDLTTDRKGARVRDPLLAKVLVLDDGHTQVGIVAMDTTAIGGRAISRGALPDVGEGFLPALRARVEEELGIPGANLLVNASHTHPPGPLLCDDAAQVERVFDALRRAQEGMVPARAGAGSGRESRITMNRTLRLKNGRHWTLRHAYPSPPDQEVAAVGPIDPEIGILRVDHADGRPLAVVYNFACHPLFGDAEGSLTANFPGVASRVIEESLGEGALALFLQGAGGDVIDTEFKAFDRPRDIEPMGMRLGLSTLRAARQIQTEDATISVASETVELPRRTDFPERIAELLQEQAALLESLRSTSLNFRSFLSLYLQHALCPDYPGGEAYRYLQDASAARDADPGAVPNRAAMDELNRRNIAKYLKNIEAMEKLAQIQDDLATLRKHQAINQEAGSPTIPAEVLGIRIGECVLVSSPAEVLTEVGLNIKRASPYKRTFLAAFSNGYMHYGPPASDYDKGGYEVTECLLAPEWQRVFEDAARRVIARL
ncbi:MAG TPA: hypothetical protein PLU39_17520 [Armatimonadota bacterium]|jgi:hypothetical protein|nr:hypothetical protein [Armatimonadota bacterium]HOM81844.1 hypothetical protein [Armatimonadota bacterium]HPO74569.1 hypothetical protein [Armatimonadota bacterium]HPT99665.1 hypothetical protein [Armatimonadota bacterium]